MAKDYNDRELINELRTKLRQNQEQIDSLRLALAELMIDVDNRNADEKGTKHD